MATEPKSVAKAPPAEPREKARTGETALPPPIPGRPKDNPWRHKDAPDSLRVIGKPLRKVDARSKVVGQTKFADDLELPRMLHMKLLRSPHGTPPLAHSAACA